MDGSQNNSPDNNSLLWEIPWLIAIPLLAGFVGPQIIQIPFIGITAAYFTIPGWAFMPTEYLSGNAHVQGGFAWLEIVSDEAFWAYTLLCAFSGLFWYVIIRLGYKYGKTKIF